MLNDNTFNDNTLLYFYINCFTFICLDDIVFLRMPNTVTMRHTEKNRRLEIHQPREDGQFSVIKSSIDECVYMYVFEKRHRWQKKVKHIITKSHS